MDRRALRATVHGVAKNQTEPSMHIIHKTLSIPSRFFFKSPLVFVLDLIVRVSSLTGCVMNLRVKKRKTKV